MADHRFLTPTVHPETFGSLEGAAHQGPGRFEEHRSCGRLRPAIPCSGPGRPPRLGSPARPRLGCTPAPADRPPRAVSELGARTPRDILLSIGQVHDTLLIGPPIDIVPGSLLGRRQRRRLRESVGRSCRRYSRRGRRCRRWRGGFGIQTQIFGVLMPSPRSSYHPVGYSTTLGTESDGGAGAARSDGSE